MITERYKVVHFHLREMNEWELFDREKAPDALRNVIDEPTYRETLVGLRAEMKRLKAELKVSDTPPDEAYGCLRSPRGPAGKK